MFIIIIMPVRVSKISVDFDPYAETVHVVTRRCYRCKQFKDIDCFKRCHCGGKHSYCYTKYAMTCSECLDKCVKTNRDPANLETIIFLMKVT